MSNSRMVIADAGDKWFRAYLEPIGDNYILSREREVFDMIPEVKPVKDTAETFHIAATDMTVSAIDRYELPVRFVDTLSQRWFSLLQARNATSAIIQKDLALFRHDGTIPNFPLIVNERKDRQPLPYQRMAAINGLRLPYYGLFMEQGTGKTLTAILVMCNMHLPARVIIVCPQGVRTNWHNELNEFGTCNAKVIVLSGDKNKRVSQLVDVSRDTGHDLNVAVMSYDVLVNTWDVVSFFDWDIAVLDESHLIKTRSATRTDYARRLRDKSKKRLILTGTPIANTMIDLYSQLEFLDEGLSGFSTYERFKKYYGKYKQVGDEGFKALVGLQNIPVIQDRLSRYSFIISKAEALPYLPPKTYGIIDCEMSPEQKKAYKQLATDLVIKIEAELDAAENKAIAVNSVLAQLLKLAELTSGYLSVPAEYSDEGELINDKYFIDYEPNHKMQTLLEELKKLPPDEKAIVWCCWRRNIIKISEMLTANGIDHVTYYGDTSEKDREQNKRRFNNVDSCKVFVGNPESAGAGLTLLGHDEHNPDASPCDVTKMYYYSMNWKSIPRSQSEDRNHRKGTRRPTHIDDLTTPNTIDEEIRLTVTSKRLTAMSITDVRQVLSNIIDRL